MRIATLPLDKFSTQWQEQALAIRDKHAKQLLQRAEQELAQVKNPCTPEHVSRLGTAVTLSTKEAVSDELLDDCIHWLQEADHWPVELAAGPFKAELIAAFETFPSFHPVLPSPGISANAYAWLIPAVIGGLLGALAGDAVGALIGSFFSTLLVSWLANHAAVKTIMRQTITSKSVSAAGEDWQASGRFNRMLHTGLAKLVILLTQPRVDPPSTRECSAHLQPQLANYLLHSMSIILSACWSYQEGMQVVPKEQSAEQVAREPFSLLEALGTLGGELGQENADLEDIRDTAEEVMQRFEDEGYFWKSVTDGTEFNAELQQQFDTFGHVAQGQQIKVLHSALLRNGALLAKGRVKKL